LLAENSKLTFNSRKILLFYEDCTPGVSAQVEHPPSSVRARVGARSRLGQEQGEGPPGTTQAT